MPDYSETLQTTKANFMKINKIILTGKDCQDNRVLNDLTGISNIKTVNADVYDVVLYFFWMSVIILMGTLFVVCLGVFDQDLKGHKYQRR